MGKEGMGVEINLDSMHELDNRDQKKKLLIEYIDAKETIQESSYDYSSLK